MRRIFPLILAGAMAIPMTPHVWSADAPAPAGGEQQELRELKQAIELQAKQIEGLAEQVGKLTKALEAQKGTTAEVSPKPAEPNPAPAPAASEETSKPAADAAAEAAKTENAPKAELPAGGTKHAIAKGETLTSIAKHYNISVAELKNANKIENERKLQIGQMLIIPTAKSPDSTDKTDKKENP